MKKNKNKTYDKKRQGTRTRNWTLILYRDDIPTDFIDRIDSLITPYCLSPIHDLDVNADGEPKKAHYHLVIKFGQVKHEQQVFDIFAELFGLSEESIVGVAKPQMITSMESMVKYLTHADNPDKAQYEEKDIIEGHGFNYHTYLKFSKQETIQKMQEIEELILNHGIYEYAFVCDLLTKLGRSDLYEILTMKHTIHFNAYIRSMRHQEQEEK